MRMWPHWSPALLVLVATGTLLVASAAWGFFAVVWFLTHSD